MATKDNISSIKDDIKIYKFTSASATPQTTTTTTTLANNLSEINKVQGATAQLTSSSLIKKQNLIPVTLTNNKKLTIFKNTGIKNGQSVLVKLNKCNKITTSGTITSSSPTTSATIVASEATTTTTQSPSVTFLTQKLGKTINIRSATGSTIIKTNLKQGQPLDNNAFIPITIKGNTTIKRFPLSSASSVALKPINEVTNQNEVPQTAKKSLITIKPLPTQSLVGTNNLTNIKSMNFKPVSFKCQQIKGPIISVVQSDLKSINPTTTIFNPIIPDLKKSQICDLTVDTPSTKVESSVQPSSSTNFENKKIFIKTTSKNYNKFLMGKNFNIKKCKMINIQNGKINTSIDKSKDVVKPSKSNDVFIENDHEEDNKMIEVIEIDDEKIEKNREEMYDEQDVFELLDDGEKAEVKDENKKDHSEIIAEKNHDCENNDNVTDEQISPIELDKKPSPMIRVKNVETLCKTRLLKRSASLQEQNINIDKPIINDIDNKLHRSLSISNINDNNKVQCSNKNNNNENNVTQDVDLELSYNNLQLSSVINNNGDLINGNRNNKPKSKDSIKNKFNEMLTSCFDEIYGNVIIPEDDLYDYVNWNDGVGYLDKSSLHFQFNEFGVIELMSSEEFKRNYCSNYNDIYNKPIYERDIQNYDKQCTDKLYSCKLCSCNGLAVDFLVPDFCSKVCLFKYKQHIISTNVSNVASTNDKRNAQISKTRKSLLKKKMYKPSSTSATSSDTSSVNYTPQDSDNEIEDDNNLNNSFNWDSYFVHLGVSLPAPLFLFVNPYPCNENQFTCGMKLEAIDPMQCNLFCVATVVDTMGYRIKIHFDGYHNKYDYWVNADSLDIFPPNWCNSTKRKLQSPKNFKDKFNWETYLMLTNSIGAPRNLFMHLNSTTNKNSFKCGMKLEANDIKNSGKICVATITDVIDHRVLVHFDGWDHCYDYWTTYSSPHLHPINFFRQNGTTLIMPPGWKGAYSWKAYLAQTNTSPTPDSIFCTRNTRPFKIGMKIEVVDKKVPSLIRPATIILVDNYEIKILYDGWPGTYAYWLDDDNQDIHPINWCKKTGHPIEFPLNYKENNVQNVCLTKGCRGIGNANESLTYHNKYKDCPYEEHNWNNIVQLNRFDSRSNLDDLNSSNENDGNLTTSTASKGSLKRLRGCSPDGNKIVNNSKERKLKTYSNNNNNNIEKKINVNNMNIATINSQTNNDYIININDDLNNSIPSNININATKNLLNDYGPSILQEKYMLWKKNSRVLNNTINDKIEKNPLKWTIDEVCSYINNIPNCSHLSHKFSEQEIDGMALLNICQNDLLKHLNIRLGPSIKIYNQIVRLREQVAVHFMKI